MTYCISDIHGCYGEFMALLEKINFTSLDALYVLGDVIDRGKESIKCLQHIIRASNVHLLMGNHEQMMFDALTSNYEKDDSLMRYWLKYGGSETLPEFCKLPEEGQIAIMDYIANLPYTIQVNVGGQNYILVHAGLNVVDMPQMKKTNIAAVLQQQNLDDLLYIREKFLHNKALQKSITIFGHTPVSAIKLYNSTKVWRDKRFNDKIGIDGGCVYGHCLLALRLDDMAEFVVNAKNGDN